MSRCGSLGLICLSASRSSADFKNLGGGFYLWLGALDGVAQLLAFSGFAQLLGPNLAAVVESYPTNTGAWVWFQILGGLFCSASIVLEYMFKLGMIGQKKDYYPDMFMGHVIKMEWLETAIFAPCIVPRRYSFASRHIDSSPALPRRLRPGVVAFAFCAQFHAEKDASARPVLEAIASSSSELAKNRNSARHGCGDSGQALVAADKPPRPRRAWSRVLKPLGEAAYDRVIEPLWRFASPWTLPVALAIMSRCARTRRTVT